MHVFFQYLFNVYFHMELMSLCPRLIVKTTAIATKDFTKRNIVMIKNLKIKPLNTDFLFNLLNLPQCLHVFKLLLFT